MENYLRAIIILVLSLVVYDGHTQITLEESLAFSAAFATIDEDETRLYLMDVNQAQCRILHADYSTDKTINITLDADYYLYDIQYVSRHIFDADDELEVLYVASKYINATTPYYQYVTGVVNEDGTSLLKVDFGAYYDVVSVDGKLKLLVWTYDYSTFPYFLQTRIYGLTGTSDLNTVVEDEPQFRPFPNPATEVLNLPVSDQKELASGMLTVYSSAGQAILSQKYETTTGVVQLNVSSFPRGAYIYTFQSEGQEQPHSNQFTVK